MNNRLTLMGLMSAALFAACPSVAAAQNPWRADPQAGGQYAPQPAPQAMQAPQAAAPKYAPLNGRLEETGNRYPALQGLSPTANPYTGLYPGGAPGAYPGAYGGGYPGAYWGGYPGLGLGPGLGGYDGWGGPIGGTGLWPGTLGPGLGGWNNLGGPMSWMPFW